ncbi:MAG: invasion associated locus B family protein [Cypionkella sp.]
MTSWILRAALSAALVLGAEAGVAQTAAATSDKLVATKTAWSVFADTSPKECWGVSKPKETLNTRDGKSVSVRRSDILLFVTFRPGQAGGETSFTGGYAFADNSSVDVDIDGQTFQMTTKGEWAWAASPDDDAKLLEALQKGTNAVLTAHSSKGTQTKDTFSLSGFTAAMQEAGTRCK